MSESKLNLDDLLITDFTEESLAKAICVISDRAKASASLLLPYFDVTSTSQPADSTIYYALSSILMEIDTLQELADDYATMIRQSQKISESAQESKTKENSALDQA